MIELDGRRGHTGERFRDMARDNLHAQTGWTTLRYGWTDVVTRPCSVARQVTTVLKAAGWERDMSLCTRCRADRELWRRASVEP